MAELQRQLMANADRRSEARAERLALLTRCRADKVVDLGEELVDRFGKGEATTEVLRLLGPAVPEELIAEFFRKRGPNPVLLAESERLMQALELSREMVKKLHHP
jgi:RNase adaptor protein for sRNA GlmZ degradation